MTDETAAKSALAERTGDGHQPSWRSPVVRLLAGLLLISSVAALALGACYLHERGKAADAREAAASRASALQAAQEFAVDFSTYDYTNLDATFDKVAAELTGDFKTQYEATAASLKTTLLKYKGKATATVQGAGVASASRSAATVVVLLDQTVTSTASPTPRIDRSRMVISLKRVKGAWLMSDLDLK